MSVSRDGSKRPPTKPVRSKRSADAMADGEVGFPMQSRPRVTLALPGGECHPQHHRNDAVDAALDPLPDPNTMTAQVPCLIHHHACYKASSSPFFVALDLLVGLGVLL